MIKNSPTKYRLLWVEGDTEDFVDLIGRRGEMRNLKGDGLTFFPESRSDWLSLVVRLVIVAGPRVRVATELGNTFVFEEVV